MTLVYGEEERLLQESARGFLSERAPVSALRQLRDQRDADGFSRELWSAMAEMGWAGIVIPEEYGGMGFSYAGAGILCEEQGRVLAAAPFFATALFSATLIRDGGSNAQKSELLTAIATGKSIVAVALDETARHDPLAIALSAAQHGEDFHLTGDKILVVDGHVADQLIVIARSAGVAGEIHGISLFLIDAKAPGVTIERTIMTDSRNAANVRLKGVAVSRGALLGELHNGWALLERSLDIGRICIAAEQLGVASAVFERTIDYLKQRKQFGDVIGGFQALQHRAAKLFCEIELCRSVVLSGLRAIDQGSPLLPLLASVAKAKASETTTLAVNEAVQMHGGMGMTDAFDIGFYMKRAATLRQLLGDAYFHTSRFATLGGY